MLSDWKWRGLLLTEKAYSQRINNGKVMYLMIKGVADYAGDLPDAAEIENLKKLFPATFDGVTILDPTMNHMYKSALQTEATKRAFQVALELMRTFPRG